MATQINNIERSLLFLEGMIAADLTTQGGSPIESFLGAYALGEMDYNLYLGYLSGAGFDLNTTVNDLAAAFVLESAIIAGNTNAG
jgi:hypothetical protein